MISLDVIVAIACTTVLTVGLGWLLYPAWIVAIEDDLGWSERFSVSRHGDAILSLVIPAYNEEDRIAVMLKAAHDFFESDQGNGVIQTLKQCAKKAAYCPAHVIEWIIVDDGSKDATCKIVKAVLQSLDSKHAWRILSLERNSGKGAAIKIGMSSARGHFSLMVDADGATEFGPGLLNLVERLKFQFDVARDQRARSISVFGSRAHLQKESAAQRSFVRTFLMRSFHMFVSILVSSSIRDTQCGFKLFTRESAQAVFTQLHLRRWAFDTEVVLLCNYHKIDIFEVSVPWQEVDGSKLNTSKLALIIVSLTMLRDMICVNICYSLRIWKAPELSNT
eukprot:scaffold2526_cov131-Cylindrotheca_fusiformis.AAC.16